MYSIFKFKVQDLYTTNTQQLLHGQNTQHGIKFIEYEQKSIAACLNHGTIFHTIIHITEINSETLSTACGKVENRIIEPD